MAETWRTATPQARWEAPSDFLDGETWPEELTLEAWERNDLGERRIRATRRYRLVEETDG